jgi:glycosyltransferase involved in cell wall biosynthesis
MERIGDKMRGQSEIAPLRVSVIIPAYGRPRPLRRCLQAMAAQDYPHNDYEVIVVDDGSEPPLQPVVDQFAAVMSVRCLRQGNAGPAAARNNGAAHARFPFLAFTDDDCRPARGWLTILAQAIAAAPESMVGGTTVNALVHNPYSAASQLLVDYLYDYFNDSDGGPQFFTSNNFICAAAAFQEAGGFDARMPLSAGEDREFCERWRWQGRGMVVAPRARVYHAHRLDGRGFWRQHWGYGRGAYQFQQLRRERTDQPVKIEPLSFYWQLVFYPFTQHHRRPLVLTSLLFLTQLANALGFFAQRCKKRHRE